MTLHIKDQGVYAAGGTVKKAEGTFDPIHGQRADAGQLRYCDHASVFYHPVEYEVEGIRVSANLYLPADYDENDGKRYAAITVAHPNGGCKEQVAGLYAQRLAELGYVTLACDARYQGASGGEPRLRDYPANRIEYYGFSHRHPNATGSYTTASFIKLMAFDTEDRMDLVDQPLLMVCGEKADTLYMSQDAFAKASGTDDKELFLIPGASHIRTYWVPEYVDAAVEKLGDFFGREL